jgi:hypothetical protein
MRNFNTKSCPQGAGSLLQYSINGAPNHLLEKEAKKLYILPKF